eukprot:GHVU01077877.1.p2 GENE.GHVU01077877.1~~GHVU01077877.1.p2  ORF type:complete len:145 (-),score=2.00 GHVU01077877.1:331-765(-)
MSFCGRRSNTGHRPDPIKPGRVMRRQETSRGDGRGRQAGKMEAGKREAGRWAGRQGGYRQGGRVWRGTEEAPGIVELRQLRQLDSNEAQQPVQTNVGRRSFDRSAIQSVARSLTHALARPLTHSLWPRHHLPTPCTGIVINLPW